VLQEFEYTPSQEFRSRLDEVELYFHDQGHALEVLLQIDRKSKGFSGWLNESWGSDERYNRLYIDGAMLERGKRGIAEALRETIRRFA
jgi:sporulation-control protein